MAQPLPRLMAELERREDERKLANILLETGEPLPTSTAGATGPGDWERLRGLPAIGRGVSGAVRGSDPMRALLSKERGRGRR